jgi:hypothetical protein
VHVLSQHTHIFHTLTHTHTVQSSHTAVAHLHFLDTVLTWGIRDLGNVQLMTCTQLVAQHSPARQCYHARRRATGAEHTSVLRPRSRAPSAAAAQITACMGPALAKPRNAPHWVPRGCSAPTAGCQPEPTAARGQAHGDTPPSPPGRGAYACTNMAMQAIRKEQHLTVEHPAARMTTSLCSSAQQEPAGCCVCVPTGCCTQSIPETTVPGSRLPPNPAARLSCAGRQCDRLKLTTELST